MDYRQRPSETTEFMLTLECCRWAFAGGHGGAVADLARQVDWRRMAQIARRHRVHGHVWRCLRSLDAAVPDGTAGGLASEAALIAQQNLRAAHQSGLLLDAFTRAGLPLIFVKGLTLGRLAYPDPLTKMSLDIDMLVAADGVTTGAAVLRQLGYRLILPDAALKTGQLERWHRRRKESVWRSPDGVQLDLHSRLADNPDMLVGIDAGSPTQQVEVAPAILLPTLAPDQLFAYLCVHGASSAWFRLKWIADIAALLHGHTPHEVEQLYARSQSLGAGRAADQALLLADRAFGTLGGSALRQELARSTASRWLANAAWSQVTQERAPTERLLGTATIHFTQMFLRPGPGFALREAWRQVSIAVARH